ncbi:MAG: cohesin domain-containing protein, partial [bacterium]|nr:cohesin domain-containing protein [bacterium]
MEKLSTSLKVFIPIGLFLLFFSVLPASAEAATLSFSPTSGSFETGSTFSVSVRVSSANQALNAISGTVSFPTDKLQVISLSKSDSIIQLWVIEPSFSNMDGTVQFEGVALNPGFTGENGGVIRVTFRAKTVGSAPVSFLTGSILANDGSGTNILSSLGTANFNIVKATAPATPIVSATEKPEISSPTHPNKDTWYANSNPEFKWALPADVIEVRLSYSSDPDGKPDTVYKAIQSKNLSNIPSGIWYFHVQFKNAGGWGDVAHYHFQIDAEKPEHFNIITLASSDSSKI